MMRLALFGASGRTGQELLRLAVSKGWSIRALVRPSSRCETLTGVELFRGSLESPEDVLATLRGTEAVCCAFGPRSTRAEPFCAAATRCIVDAMKAWKFHRLVCLTGATAGELPPNISFAMRAMAAVYRRQVPLLAADAAEQERVVIDSGLEWTLVKPPRLTSGPPAPRIRAGPTLPVGLLSHISRADLASFMLDEAAGCRHLRQRVYVCA